MLKKFSLCAATLILEIVCLVFMTSAAHAIVLKVNPISQNALLGNSIGFTLNIAGLGDSSAPSLGVFDLDLNFDPAILTFHNVIFGDPVLGDQLDLFGLGSLNTFDDTTPGMVNLYELSFDLPSDLNTLQIGSFTLASLTFDSLALGISPLNISINSLGDAWGNHIVLDTVNNGSVAVATAVPVGKPFTCLLLVSGLIGMAGIKRKLA